MLSLCVVSCVLSSFGFSVVSWSLLFVVWCSFVMWCAVLFFAVVCLLAVVNVFCVLCGMRCLLFVGYCLVCCACAVVCCLLALFVICYGCLWLTALRMCCSVLLGGVMVRCLMFVGRCVFCDNGDRRSLFVVCYLLFVGCCLLRDVCWCLLLLAVWCLLFAIGVDCMSCSLFVACCLLVGVLCVVFVRFWFV